MPSTTIRTQQTILFVDFTEKVENLLRSGILGYPCMMQFAPHGRKQALTLIKNDPPDLLVAGLELQDGNGIELIREIHKTVGKVPAILIAKNEQSSLHDEALRLGLFDLIHTPYETPQLVQKIDRAVRATSALRQKSRLESFVEYAKLQEESVNKGLFVGDLIEKKMPA